MRSMKNTSTQKLARMGRRRFLDTLSKIGVSTAALPYLSKENLDELTADPTEQVPRIFAHRHTNHEKVVSGEEPPKREPQMFTISRDTWARIEGRNNAASKLSQKFTNEPRIRVGIAKPREESELVVEAQYIELKTASGERLTPNISYEEFEASLPDRTSAIVGEGEFQREVEDIKVISRNFEAVEDASNYFNSKYRPIPGGCANQSENWSCEGGTIGTPAYNKDSFRHGWMTAAHVVGWDTGVPLEQPNCMYTNVGESTKVTEDGRGDVGFVKSYDGSDNVEYDIADDNGGYMDWPVEGSMSHDGIVDLMDNEEGTYVQGKATGRWDTLIRFIDDKGDEPIMVGGYADTDNGDSGGPYFYVDDSGSALMIGIHKGTNDNGNYGTAAYYAEDELNLLI